MGNRFEDYFATEWCTAEDGKHKIDSSKSFDDIRDQKNRIEIKSFLHETINIYVNTFRPRLDKISDEIQ